MPNTPIFGSNQNVPFIFNQNATPRTPHQDPWVPPPAFSPEKAFPTPTPPVQGELKDVDMSEVSPNKTEEPKQAESGGRRMAVGALRRVFLSRQKSRDLRLARREVRGEDDAEDDLFDSDDDEDRQGLVPQSTSNHYTLNMAAPPPPQSDLPYILSGSVVFSHLVHKNDPYNVSIQISPIHLQPLTHSALPLPHHPIHPHRPTRCRTENFRIFNG